MLCNIAPWCLFIQKLVDLQYLPCDWLVTCSGCIPFLHPTVCVMGQALPYPTCITVWYKTGKIMDGRWLDEISVNHKFISTNATSQNHKLSTVVAFLIKSPLKVCCSSAVTLHIQPRQSCSLIGLYLVGLREQLYQQVLIKLLISNPTCVTDN